MKKENSKKTIIFSILLTIDFVIGIIGYYKMNFNSSLLFVEWIRKIFSIPYGKEFSVGIFDRGERLFWYVWIFTMAILVTIIEHELQNNKSKINKKAILKNEAPYLKIFYIYEKSKTKKSNNSSSKKWRELLYRIKMIEEQLSVEKEFGYGDDKLTDCENEISYLLDNLEVVIDKSNNVLADDDIEKIDSLIEKIKIKLELRKKMMIH